VPSSRTSNRPYRDGSPEGIGRERILLIAFLGLAVVVGGYFAYHWFRRPPQMGNDPAVFETVDALYTAVREHDEKRVADCAQRLQVFRDAGTLTPAASRRLDAVIGQTRSGAWDQAARQLYDFMLAQRRDAPAK
jgi:hypothetical protein